MMKINWEHGDEDKEEGKGTGWLRWRENCVKCVTLLPLTPRAVQYSCGTAT